MNRSLALAAWIALSFLCVAEVQAASNEPTTPQQSETNVDQQSTPTTPAAALFWQAREKARYENKVRAEALRNQEIGQETAQDNTTTTTSKPAKKKQGKSKGSAK